MNKSRKSFLKSFKPGDKIIIFRGEYAGFTGKVEYCKTCCRALRIQFDGIANNERLSRYRKNAVRL
jgi:transcription antitermination factor NusG